MGHLSVRRHEVLRLRVAAHQLDREPGRAHHPRDVDLLDIGVLDAGDDGAAWALALRGAPAAGPDELARVWTVRGAPHVYRRSDLANVAVATAPFSEADAARRVLDAAKPLREADIPVLDALTIVARHLREIARDPITKGDASTLLTTMLGTPYLHDCSACETSHIYETTLRLASLQAALELEPGTIPPVLRRIPGMEPPAFARPGSRATPRHDLVRGYLRFYGPSSPAEVAAFLDAPVRDVREVWPSDVVDVTIEDVPAEQRTLSVLADDAATLRRIAREEHPPARGVRLLGSHDPYLQARDHELLVPDAANRRDLWRSSDRPGAVLAGDEIVGTWRARVHESALTVRLNPWQRWPVPVQRGLEDQISRLAAHRGAREVEVQMSRDHEAIAV